jgi:hypothetical protein
MVIERVAVMVIERGGRQILRDAGIDREELAELL